MPEEGSINRNIRERCLQPAYQGFVELLDSRVEYDFRECAAPPDEARNAGRDQTGCVVPGIADSVLDRIGRLDAFQLGLARCAPLIVRYRLDRSPLFTEISTLRNKNAEDMRIRNF